jgi:hypothetical protein
MSCDYKSARMTSDTTMTLDRISATTTYVMWCEEHLCNVGALQRVDISNLVTRVRKMRWVGVACMTEAKNAHKVLIGEHEGKKSFGRPRCS